MSGDIVEYNIGAPDGFGYVIELVKKSDGQEKRYGVSRFVSEFNIFESVSNKSMSLMLGFVDAAGLIQAIGFTTGDIIDVTLYKDANGKKVSGLFYVMDIADGDRTENSQGRTYTITGLTRAAYMDKKSTVNRSYKGTLSSALVAIAKEYLDVDVKDVETSRGERTVVMPRFGAFQVIDWICKHALSDSGSKDSLYYFYETSDGFHFKTLRKIIADATTYTYTMSVDSNRNEDATDIFRLLDFSMVQVGDHVEKMEKGIFENELMQFNHLDRSITSNKFSYKDQYSEIHLLGPNPTTQFDKNYDQWVTDPSEERIGIRNHTRIRSDDAAYGQYNGLTEKYGHTVAQGRLFNQINFAASMFGNSALRAGDIIEVDAPEFAAKETKGLDYLANGKFLIVNVHHQVIQGEKYWTFCDVVKDGLDTALTKV